MGKVTIEQIKALLAQCEPISAQGEVLCSGTLSAQDGTTADYELQVGWDLLTANICDDSWGAFNVALMRFIKNQKYDKRTLEATLQSVQLDDSHWRWLDKSLYYKGDQYRWFFLMAEGYPQAACLIYHPKPSAIDRAEIFYIEYVAVAPWNRSNPMRERSFVGVGKLLIKLVTKYAIEKLGLQPGFSLHALPKATGFYLGLGMVRIPDFDKDTLPYFEMPCHKKDHGVAA